MLCAPGGTVDPRPALGCLSWNTPSCESMPAVSVQIGIAWVSASVRRILSAQFRVVGFKHIGKRPGAALRQPCPRLCLGSLSPARHVSSEGNSGIGRLAGTLARHRTAPPMPQASSQGLLKFAAIACCRALDPTHVASEAMGRWARCSYCSFPLHTSNGKHNCSCRSDCYCDRVCQRRHWRRGHKEECSYAAFTSTEFGRVLPPEVLSIIFSGVKTRDEISSAAPRDEISSAAPRHERASAAP